MPSLKSLNHIAMLTTKSVATSHLTVFFLFWKSPCDVNFLTCCQASCSHIFHHKPLHSMLFHSTPMRIQLLHIFTECSTTHIWSRFCIALLILLIFAALFIFSSPNKLGTETRLKLNNRLATLGEILSGAAFSGVACVACVHIKSPLKSNLLEVT